MNETVNWEKIENQLWSPFFTVHFELNGHKISVQKQTTSVTKSVLTVYIDNKIRGDWTQETFPIVKKVWCETKRKCYKKKEQEQLIKIWGKREANKRYDFSKTYSTFLPSFQNEKRFLRQFKKIKGLKHLPSEE